MFYFNSANDSKVEKFKNYLKIQTNSNIWDNSIIVPLNYLGIKKNSFLKIKCSVLSGKIGIGLVGDNFSKYLFNETFVDKKSDSNIQIPVNTKSKNLIIRNVSNNISKYKLYKIIKISEKESQKLSSFSNLENKFEFFFFLLKFDSSLRV